MHLTRAGKTQFACTEKLDRYYFPATDAERPVADRFNWRGQFNEYAEVLATMRKWTSKRR